VYVYMYGCMYLCVYDEYEGGRTHHYEASGHPPRDRTSHGARYAGIPRGGIIVGCIEFSIQKGGTMKTLKTVQIPGMPT
jgi:hypothetical protein